MWTAGPIDRDAVVYVAGHRGLVGSAVWRHLLAQGFENLVGFSSAELDLCDRPAVFDLFTTHRPSVVVLAAARVGGIQDNATHPVDYLSTNLQIQVNVMDAALGTGVDRLLFLGSSCIYPKHAPQPISEAALLTGPLETTNEAYAAAKIAGLLQVRAVRRQHGRPWISAMPTNIYGPGDTYAQDRSHVLAAFIARYEAARRAGASAVTHWGTGTPRREFLHVDDLAAACLHLLERYGEEEHVNVGTGRDISIAELADLVGDLVGFEGETSWDPTRPDGTPRKLLDVSRIQASGWSAGIGLREGVASTIAAYRDDHRDDS